jgi:hypothetical protein
MLPVSASSSPTTSVVTGIDVSNGLRFARRTEYLLAGGVVVIDFALRNLDWTPSQGDGRPSINDCAAAESVCYCHELCSHRLVQPDEKKAAIS